MRIIGDEVILQDTRPRKEKVRIPADENGPSRLVLPGQETTQLPISAAKTVVVGGGDGLIPQAESPQLVDVRGETLASLTWADYLEWRKTKCRPYDYTEGPNYATAYPFKRADEFAPLTAMRFGDNDHPIRVRALEEIDQAIHEFVGECAELAELFEEHGPNVFYGEARAKLIDECGDVLFCGAWVLDAWGNNPLYGSDDLELLRVTDGDTTAILANAIRSGPERAAIPPQAVNVIRFNVMNLLLAATTYAGLLCNSFKKLRFQRRAQDVDKQVARVCRVFVSINQILILANSSVEEALRTNQRKLNARYPDGYQAGQGGGIREGAGA